MAKLLGSALRDLRECKFPGHSLRKVGGVLSDKFSFGEYFYTQLNKMEMGAVTPSVELLNRLLEAYGATKVEKEHVFQQLFSESALSAAEDLSLNKEKAVGILYRKVKKKN